MAAEWYCNLAGSEIGPLKPSQVRQLALEGRLRPDDFVRKGMAGPWVRAKAVKGIFGESSALESPNELPSEPSTLPVAGAHQARDNRVSQAPLAPIPIQTNQQGATSRPPSSAPVAQWRAQRNRARARRRLFLLATGFLAVIAAAIFIVFRPPAVVTPGGADRAAGPEHCAPDFAALELEIDLLDETATSGTNSGRKTTGGDSSDARPLEAPVDTDSATEAGGNTVDAPGKKSALLAGVEVTVDSVLLGPPRLERAPGRFARPSNSYLIVNLTLKGSNDAKRLDYKGWSNFQSVSLVDDLENQYPQKRFRMASVVGQVDQTGLYSDAPVSDVLVFERPVSKARRLRLRLPGIALGEQGSVEFVIPVAMIEEFSTDADAVSDEAGAADAGGAEKPAANPAPVNADIDADGDVSKIMQDIEALGGGDGSEETPLDFGEEEDRAALKRQPEE